MDRKRIATELVRIARKLVTARVGQTYSPYGRVVGLEWRRTLDGAPSEREVSSAFSEVEGEAKKSVSDLSRAGFSVRPARSFLKVEGNRAKVVVQGELKFDDLPLPSDIKKLESDGFRKG